MKILLSVDGSPYSDAAIELVARLPWDAGTEVTILRVTECYAPFDPEGEAVEPEEREALAQLERELAREAEQGLAHSAERLIAAGLSVRTEIRRGEPVGEILDLAQGFGCGLIVLGARGEGQRDRFPLGGVCRGVLRNAPCSVLVARPTGGNEGNGGQSDPPRLRIVATLEPTEVPSANLRLLAAFPPSADVEITVLAVMTVVTTLYQRDVLERLSQTWQAHRSRTEARLAKAADSLRRVTPHVATRLLDGSTHASDEILTAAEVLGAELLMVDRSRKGRFKAWLEGNVASEVTEHALCSVWIVCPSSDDPDRLEP